MNYIVEFYKELDTVNLIIFWGVIIVVLLLLTFAIIIANKNKKLERIIEKNGIDIDNYDDEELAIKKETNIKIIKEENHQNDITHKEEVSHKSIINDNINVEKEKAFTPLIINEQANADIETPVMEMPNIEEKIPNEDKFVVEEHVMEYRSDTPKITNIERKNINNMPEKEVVDIRTPYERNVLRKMSSNQTSPIGIAIRHTNSEKEITKAKELHEALNEQAPAVNEIKNSTNDEYLINQKRYANTYKETARKGDYLEELSKKLSSAQANDISRTEYELKQEEDAIISYQELMEKKDSIKTIDEEEAVISIDELIAKKKQQEKIYNLTKEEENDDFIKELKHFRSDL